MSNTRIVAIMRALVEMRLDEVLKGACDRRAFVRGDSWEPRVSISPRGSSVEDPPLAIACAEHRAT